MKLGQILIKQQSISCSKLEDTLQIQSQQVQQLGHLLVDQGQITTEQLTTALQEQYWRVHGYWVID